MSEPKDIKEDKSLTMVKNNSVVWALTHPLESLKAATRSGPPSQPNEWIINGKVYDLSAWIEKHPGGSNILLINRGRDCTELFMTYHILSSVNIELIMKQYYIRDASKEEIQTPYNWNDDQFISMYNDLKHELINYFNNKNMSSKASYNTIIYHSLLILLLFYIIIFYWFEGYWFSNILLGILLWLISSNVMHSGTHYAIFSNYKYNELVADVFGFYHCFSELWIWQHVLVHHAYTNMSNKDIDLYWWYGHHRLHPLQTNLNSFIRNKWKNSMLFLVSMTSIGAMMRAIEITFNKSNSLPVDFDPQILSILFKFFDYKRFLIFLIQFFLIFILFPYLLINKFGFFCGILFYVLPRFVHGTLYYIFSQVSHASDASFRNIKMKQSDNFIIHQILSSVDYCTDSLFWNILSIGLNNQVMHHLAPSIYPQHHIDLEKKILIPFCKKYDIKRVNYNSFYKTLCEHWLHLKTLND